MQSLPTIESQCNGNFLGAGKIDLTQASQHCSSCGAGQCLVCSGHWIHSLALTSILQHTSLTDQWDIFRICFENPCVQV